MRYSYVRYTCRIFLDKAASKKIAIPNGSYSSVVHFNTYVPTKMFETIGTSKLSVEIVDNKGTFLTTLPHDIEYFNHNPGNEKYHGEKNNFIFFLARWML